MLQTEAGYSTLYPGQGNFDGSYTERAQARLTLQLLAASYKAGVAATYLYELFDSDPSGASCNLDNPQREARFGLIRCDYSLKPAAVALANMAAVVKDAQPQALGGALNFTITGIPDYKTLLLQRTDGGFILMVWREPEIFNSGCLCDVEAPVHHGTVAFGETAKSVAVYDPIVGADEGAGSIPSGPPTPQPVAQASNAASIAMDVSDHPVLILINGTTGLGQTALQNVAMNAAGPTLPTAGAAETTDVPDGASVADDGSVVFSPDSASNAPASKASNSKATNAAGATTASVNPTASPVAAQPVKTASSDPVAAPASTTTAEQTKALGILESVASMAPGSDATTEERNLYLTVLSAITDWLKGWF